MPAAIIADGPSDSHRSDDSYASDDYRLPKIPAVKFLKTHWIGKVCRIVGHISVVIHVASRQADRIVVEKSSNARIVVTCPKQINNEIKLIIGLWLLQVLKWIDDWSSDSPQA